MQPATALPGEGTQSSLDSGDVFGISLSHMVSLLSKPLETIRTGRTRVPREVLEHSRCPVLLTEQTDGGMKEARNRDFICSPCLRGGHQETRWHYDLVRWEVSAGS